MSEHTHTTVNVKKRRSVIGACLCVAVLIAAGVLLVERMSDPVAENFKPAKPPAPIPLTPETNNLVIYSKGVVKPSQVTLLAPGVSGKVNKVCPDFSPGEVLAKGTPIIEIENSEYRARLANAQAELEKARLDVLTEQAEALKALKKTYGSGSKSGKDSELVLRVPQRRAVNARQDAAQAYVEEAQQTLKETVMETPYTCVVVESSVGTGERVTAGQTIGKIIPLTSRIVRIALPLEDFSSLPRTEEGKIDAKLTAYCKLRNGSRLQWNGHITAVDSALDDTGNSVVLIASLDPNMDLVREWRVAPVNMTLQVSIKVQIPNSFWISDDRLTDEGLLPVITPTGKEYKRVNIISKKDDRLLILIPGYRAGDCLEP